MKQLLVALSVAITLLGTSGCATLADAKAAKGSGTVRIYDHPLDQVWATIIEVVNASDLDLVSENKATGEILAQNSISAFSYGENVAIFVEEVGGRVQTRVEVINKRAMSTNVFAANWESRIHESLEKRFNK